MFNLPVKQMLMFPDPRPLVELLGREFFRTAPECPGVYLMRNQQGVVLYVGKARNLRKRLNAYRVANPDRMARRHLRLLRSVAHIDFQPCPDEPAALAREAELIRSLKPRFNRSGTWPAPPRFLLWRNAADQIELAVAKESSPEWRAFGPLGGSAPYLRNALARLLWFALHPALGAGSLPFGWAEGRTGNSVVITGGPATHDAANSLALLFSGQPEAFCDWVRAKLPQALHPFDAAMVQADIDFLVSAPRLDGRAGRVEKSAG